MASIALADICDTLNLSGKEEDKPPWAVTMALLKADMKCHALKVEVLPSLKEKVDKFGTATGFDDKYHMYVNDVKNKVSALEGLVKSLRAQLVRLEWDIQNEWRLKNQSFQNQHDWARAIRDELERIFNNNKPHCKLTDVKLAMDDLEEYQRAGGNDIPESVGYLLWRRQQAGQRP